MTMSPTQSGSQECGLPDFNKDSDVLVIAPGMEVPEGAAVIIVKGIRRVAIVKPSGGTFGTSSYRTYDAQDPRTWFFEQEDWMY